ncbi:MAG: OB-fold domain-containing protein [Actinomycetota bacterium]|nr:OB-fold domain-containing protein [Actinomycetota bacterium]
MSELVPIVDYLVLTDSSYLEANECSECSARFFDRRNACAACGGTSFTRTAISNQAILTSFSIVHRAAPSVPVPFVSAIVKTDDGTSVRSNVVGLDDPMDAELGMKLVLTTYSCGVDDDGTECIAFGYEPA